MASWNLIKIVGNSVLIRGVVIMVIRLCTGLNISTVCTSCYGKEVQ